MTSFRQQFTPTRSPAVSLAHQTQRELDSLRGTLPIALLRPGCDVTPGFGDFSQTLVLYRQGQLEAERFLLEHWLGAQHVRPGVMEFEAPEAVATVVPRGRPPRRPLSVFERVRRRTAGPQRAKPAMTPAD